MPNERAIRLRREYMLSEFDSENLVLDKNVADFYEEGVNIDPLFGLEEYKQYCNWLMNSVSGWLNDKNTSLEHTNLTPRHLVDLINFIKEGKLTTKIAKSFMDDMMKGNSISEIMKWRGKTRISDNTLLKSYAVEVINENPTIVEDCRENMRAIEALIGKIMRKTKGQADPEITRKILLDI